MLKTFTFLLEISISLCIIYYLNQLDKIGCKCSLNYKHDYILYYTIFILLYAFLKYLGGQLSSFRMFQLIIFIPLMIAGIVNIVYTIQYVNDLKEKKCECSESVFREGMYILAIIRLCVIVLLFILFFSLIFQDPTSFKKMVSNKAFWNKVINKSKK